MIDKNLWRQMSGYKGLLLASSACGILCAVAILWQAFTLAGILNAVFLEKAVLDGLWPQLGQLLFWVTLRFVLQALEEYFAFRLGQGIQFDLRQAFLQKIDAIGPVVLRQEQKGQLL